MNKQKYKRIFKNLGLSDNESQIYLSALSLGPTTVLSISKATGIRRTTVYTVIESLKQKGLIRTEISGLKKKYVAEHPEHFGEMLERKKEELNNILPDLSSIYTLGGDESVIKLHEGSTAIHKVYDSLLKEVNPDEFFYIISDSKKFIENDPDYAKKYIEKRGKTGADIKLLLSDSKDARYYKKYEDNFGIQIKILPKDRDFTANITIVPKKLIIHQMVSLVSAIVVENKAVIDLQKNMFEMLWESI